MTLLLALACASLAAPPSLAQEASANDARSSSVGPFVGHVSHDEARLWARLGEPGVYSLTASAESKEDVTVNSEASAANDLCLNWSLAGLTAGTAYQYRVTGPGGALLMQGKPFHFHTAALPEEATDVRLMFGSCAKEDEGTGSTWRAVASSAPDAVILLGDTPYIDKTDLRHQRRRYGEFAAFAPMADLLRSTPWYGTWDDHDFGRNDTDGGLQGQASARQAFVEYHANPSYGDGERGIYTSFRRGPIEVFLLDTRTFAATEPSPFRPHSASLLGAAQWRWLQDGLESSTAPVKVLACGMIWNGSVRPGKLDHWGSYTHERDALFRFIGAKKIQGALLIGGDIHRSRVVLHASRDMAGYDIHELIVSPMHDSIIRTANQPHPGLLKDMGEPHTFLLLDAVQQDGQLQSVTATFRNASGADLYSLALGATY